MSSHWEIWVCRSLWGSDVISTSPLASTTSRTAASISAKKGLLFVVTVNPKVMGSSASVVSAIAAHVPRIISAASSIANSFFMVLSSFNHIVQSRFGIDTNSCH